LSETPKALCAWQVVHELGHVLDEVLNFEWIAAPITKYAESNRCEAFAEAFVGYLYRYGNHPLDEATLALFDSVGDA